MELHTFWFILIAVLWIGYLVLEGFDFGVGMLLPVLGRNDTERRPYWREILTCCEAHIYVPYAHESLKFLLYAIDRDIWI